MSSWTDILRSTRWAGIAHFHKTPFSSFGISSSVFTDGLCFVWYRRAAIQADDKPRNELDAGSRRRIYIRHAFPYDQKQLRDSRNTWRTTLYENAGSKQHSNHTWSYVSGTGCEHMAESQRDRLKPMYPESLPSISDSLPATTQFYSRLISAFCRH